MNCNLKIKTKMRSLKKKDDVVKNKETYKRLMLFYINKLPKNNNHKSILDKYYIELLEIFNNVLIKDIYRFKQSVIITDILLKKVLSKKYYKSFNEEFGINFLTINYLLPGNTLYNSILSNKKKVLN